MFCQKERSGGGGGNAEEKGEEKEQGRKKGGRRKKWGKKGNRKGLRERKRGVGLCSLMLVGTWRGERQECCP